MQGEPRVDRYRCLERLSSSAMAEVWRALDTTTATEVALKLAPRSCEGVARRLRGLDHPHVVRIRDVGAVEDRSFVALEWVAGLPLDRWLRAHRRRWPKVLRVVLQAARGLAAAHGHGVVHGDFKPQNVIVDGNEAARVTDFGGRGEAGSTVGYLAPERLHGGAASPAADQFALCVTAYEALYRQPPFVDRDARLFGRPQRPPRGLAPDAVYTSIERGLTADPGARHGSVTAFVDTLEAALRR